eukprot:1918760-Prymnesium_polylepis.1
MALWRDGVMALCPPRAPLRYGVMAFLMGLPAPLRYSVMPPDRRCSITPWGGEAWVGYSTGLACANRLSDSSEMR